MERQLLGQVTCNMNPWTAGGKSQVENCLSSMAKLIKEGGTVLMPAFEGHVTPSAAFDIQAWAGLEKCEAVVAPTSTTAQRLWRSAAKQGHETQLQE